MPSQEGRQSTEEESKHRYGMHSEQKSEKSIVDNKKVLDSTEHAYSEDTLVEELAREIMRPVIKEWLDNNLPQLVERAVTREIERLSELAKGNK